MRKWKTNLTEHESSEVMQRPVSRPAMDQSKLARWYDFSDKRLGFIINYNIEYRMGKDEEEAS